MIFAYAQSLLCLAAAVTYFIRRDVWHGTYWLLAAALTLCVTRMK